MRKLDEEMQLNAFLFQDIEQKEETEAPIKLNHENKKIEEEIKSSDDKKKEYILRRAQIIVYKYGKKQEMYKKIINCALALIAFGIIGFSYRFIQNDILIYSNNIVYMALCGIGIYILILVVFWCKLREKKLCNIREDIYSITVKFQTGVGAYNSEDKQENLEVFVKDLEEYIREERYGRSERRSSIRERE